MMILAGDDGHAESNTHCMKTSSLSIATTGPNGGANPLRTRPRILLAASAVRSRSRRGVHPFDEVQTTPHLVGFAGARRILFLFFGWDD